MKKYLFIILIWLWLTMALLALFISRTPPFHFMGLKSLVLFIESSKLFFIVIIFPLIINNFCHEDTKSPRIPCSERGNLSYGKDCLKLFAIFILFFLPLMIMASHLGTVDWGILLRANLLLLLMTVFLALLFLNLPEKHNVIYYLVVFMLYGIGPILYYLVLELTDTSWSILFLLNPFWLFWKIGNAQVFNTAWLVQCLIWVTLIIITLVINRIRKEKY